jgi:hypothetical protein
VVDRTVQAIVTVLVGCVAVAPAAAAQATVVDPGPVRALAGGEGRLVWARETSGAVTAFVVRTPAVGAETVIPVAPLRSVLDADVGLDRAGRPTLVYRGCRTRCAVFWLRLDGGAERRLRLPPAPKGCSQGTARLARRLYLVRRDASHTGSCARPGVFEFRRSRAIRRAAGQIFDFDVSRGRIVFVRARPRHSLITQILLADGSRARLLIEDSAPAGGVSLWLLARWDGDRLWVGRSALSIGGYQATVYRYARPARPGVCRAADVEIDPAAAGFALLEVGGWAFVDDSIYAAVMGVVSPAPVLTFPQPLLGLTVDWRPCPPAI